MPIPGLEYEIRRLREWRHGEAQPAIAGLLLRVHDLERRCDETDARLEKYLPLIDNLSHAEEIAAAVALELKKRGPAIPFSAIHTGWKILAAVVVIVDAAAAVKVIVGG